MNRALVYLFLFCSWLLIAGIGCGDDDDDSSESSGQPTEDDDDAGDDDDDDDDTVEGFGFENLEVEWFSCSLVEGADDGRAQCSSTPMPFDWYNQDGRTFTSYAKRLLSSSKASEGQLWLLHGGPGASGVIGFPYFMEYLQDLYPELDVYTLDPRGSGYSEYVGCPDQESPSSPAGSDYTDGEIDDCIEYLEDEYGDDLAVFNTTNSSIDLAAYIHHTQEESKKVLIWGGSGGTFWGQRYLQNFPDQADGMIFEGIEPADGSLVFQDEAADMVTGEILQMCKDDLFCSSKLAEPMTTLLDLYDKLDQGHCFDLGVSQTLLRQTLDYLVYYHPHHTTIPALIYRLDRCNEDDKDAIVHFYDAVFGGGKGADPGHGISVWDTYFSTVLFFNETVSELWEHFSFATNDDLVAYLDDVYEDSLMGSGKGYDRNDIYLKWNRYEDPLDNQWAQTEVPMLMLQGALDPATPAEYAAELEDHFNNDTQHFALLPYSPHNVGDGSPYPGDPDDLNCGMRMWLEFMKDPAGALDMSCIDQAQSLDFEGTQYAEDFFGTVDYWENPEKQVQDKGAGLFESPRMMLIKKELNQKFRTSFPEFLRWIEGISRR